MALSEFYERVSGTVDAQHKTRSQIRQVIVLLTLLSFDSFDPIATSSAQK